MLAGVFWRSWHRAPPQLELLHGSQPLQHACFCAAGVTITTIRRFERQNKTVQIVILQSQRGARKIGRNGKQGLGTAKRTLGIWVYEIIIEEWNTSQKNKSV